MSVIIRNEMGAIAVNKGVLEKMIIDDLLEMHDYLSLCNKKGKPIKTKTNDYYDAIEIYQKNQYFKVKVFIITIFGCSITQIADEIFDRVERDFAMLRLDKPGSIAVNIRGLQTPKQLVHKSIEICRRNQ